ncbi:MAG: hypothetical protein JWQ11_2353, partial [Rhizobacter sp.]|nr:hypothetical protein [Rhizobacter sp.]
MSALASVGISSSSASHLLPDDVV